MSLLICPVVFHAIGQNIPSLSVHGVKIFVKDLKEARYFYSDLLGFKVLTQDESEIKLQTNIYPIYLHLGSQSQIQNYGKEARTGLSIETSKLLPTIDRFRKMNIKVHDLELERNGVGIAIPFEDPSGNVLHLIEVQIREIPYFEGLRVYNSGVTVSDMAKAMNFYENILGFEEWSKDYLPKALPLKHKDGSFAFMIHYRENLSTNTDHYGSYPSMAIILNVPNLKEYQSYLTKNNVWVDVINEALILRDPEGNQVEIVGKATNK